MRVPGFVHSFVVSTRSNFNGTKVCTRPTFARNLLSVRTTRWPQNEPPSVHSIVMFEDNLNEDDIETIDLKEPLTGRTITVGIEYQFECEDDDYMMCFPLDDPVLIVYEEDEELVEVEDEDKVREMIPNAERALSAEGILLKNSAYWLTIDDTREVEEEEEEEGTEVYAEFVFKGKEYMVVEPPFPVYMIAKQVDNGYHALVGEELERVSPIADEAWEKMTAEQQKKR